MSPVIVTSVPLAGEFATAGADAAAAAQLALEDAGCPAEHRVLDAGPEPQGRHVALNARAAADDSSVVAYLGDFATPSTMQSLPILEIAGVPQINFSSTYCGLVGRTYFHVIPADDAQTADLVAWMIELGIERLYLLETPEYGHDMSTRVHRAWAAAGRSIAGLGRPERPADLQGDLGLADGIFVGSVADAFAAGLLRAAHERNPGALLFAMDRLATPPLLSALPETIIERLRIETAARPPEDLPPRGQAVVERLASQLGHEPNPFAVYAYEAMALVAAAVQSVGADREAIANWLRAVRDRDGVVGQYSLTALGATTLAHGGRLRVVDGDLQPAR